MDAPNRKIVINGVELTSGSATALRRLVGIELKIAEERNDNVRELADLIFGADNDHDGARVARR
jgi:hypothetical protein